MSRARVIIADDERLSRHALRAQLEKRKDLVVVAECADGRTALAAIEREEPDLVFLDVEMPHLNGFEVLDRLELERPAIVFVTAYDEHAIRAFDVQAVDYVLKPFEPVRLHAAVDRALARRREQALSAGVELVLGSAAGETGAAGDRRHARRLLIRQAGRASFVPVREVDWIEAAGNDVRLHVGAHVHLMRSSISAIEQRLDPAQFMRIHRSTIINLDRIGHIEPYGGSDYRVVLRDGTKLRVSRSSRDRLLQDLL